MVVGQTAETRRFFDEQEHRDFAVLAGVSPTDQIPEPLIAALISYLLGVKLPGPGTNYLKQDLKYLATAPAATELVARVEVTRLRPANRLVDLWATCHAGGILVAEGRALVKAPAQLFV